MPLYRGRFDDSRFDLAIFDQVPGDVIMVIEEKIYEILSAESSVTDLCPASRIKVPGDWQGLDRPYVVHFPVSIEPTRDHSGLKALRVWDFYQVSIVSDTYATGSAVAVAVRDAMDGIHADGVDIQFRPGPWYIGRDDETNTENFALTFRIAEAL
jgi:hypothetical protein